MFAMVGAIFLFMYWPSFNGILGVGMARHRAAVNTVLSITASTLSAVYVSRCLYNKIDMEVLANATLAGGVMMGAGCHLITVPGFAMLAGMIAGIISALGFHYLKGWMEDKFKLHDTCGVQWLHGVPGTLGSILAGIAVACLEQNFVNDAQIGHMMSKYPDRDIPTQTGYQFLGIVITWVISIPTGALFGFLASKMPSAPKFFDDKASFMHCEYADDLSKFDNCEEHNMSNKVEPKEMEMAPSQNEAFDTAK